MTMAERSPRTPNLLAEIDVAEKIPVLRTELGQIIRNHISFPKSIGDEEITPDSYRRDDHDVVVASRGSIHELSSTRLKCVATLPGLLGKRETVITIISSGYPFEDNETGGLRPVSFTLAVDKLGYTFDFPSAGGARINKGNQFEKKHMEIVREILDLVKDPKTTFQPQPYTIGPAAIVN